MKKALSFVFVVLMAVTSIIAFIPSIEAEAVILNSSNVKGSNFTDSEALANMLDIVFSGDIDIYTSENCSQEAYMPVDTSFSKTNYYYVKSKASGTVYQGKQCYIYANAVYNKIFNEVVYNGSNFAHSKVVISGGSQNVSYEIFKNAGVRCGAYMRTTGNSDGSYSGNIGHSMIVLSYDSNYIIYLGGNQANGGEIDIRKETWSEFNNGRVGGRGRYISHIVQPTDEYYEKLYPSHKCTEFDGLGICTECGKSYNWQNTYDTSCAGKYTILDNVSPCIYAPYYDAEKDGYALEKGKITFVLGSYTNAFNELWYHVLYFPDASGFVNSKYLEFSDHYDLEVTARDLSLNENTSLYTEMGYPFEGVVESNYPLKKVVAKLDGSEYATWNASNDTTTSFEIGPTAIDDNLKFANVPAGKHTVTLTATDIHGRTQTFLTVNFNMVSKSCNHTYGSVYGKDDNCHWNICTKCGSSASISAHSYTDACDTSCNVCGATRITSHQYDNTCDINCNVCNAVRTITHKYTDDCDVSCNVCGEMRATTHQYDNACDTSCNECGATRITSHQYDNACDSDCNVCGFLKPESEILHTSNNNYSSNEKQHWTDCVYCGKMLDAENHIPGDAATETTPQICTECGYVSTAALGHTHKYGDSYVWNAHQHWFECEDTSCGAKKDIEDHSFDGGVVIKEPTTTEKGEKMYTCIECGEKRYEDVDPIVDDLDDSKDDESSEDKNGVGNEKDHSVCKDEASGWKKFWRAIGNFFRSIFGLPKKCVCGDVI